MFFYLSKIFWALAQPLSVFALLSLLALLLMALGRRRFALVVQGTAVLLMSLVSFTSLGYVIIQPLENRFPQPSLPQSVSTIMVLGGATMARPSTARQVAELNQAGDRLAAALWLAQRFPTAQIVLSGGAGFLQGETESEADTMRRLLVGLGVEESRLVLEDQSRNTAENASLSETMIRDGGGPVVLVTSAFHMPRSVGIFRQQGIEVLPWPTDYRSGGNQGFEIDIANPNQNLETTTVALREWIGLVAYRLTGQLPELLPGPQ